MRKVIVIGHCGIGTTIHAALANLGAEVITVDNYDQLDNEEKLRLNSIKKISETIYDVPVTRYIPIKKIDDHVKEQNKLRSRYHGRR